MIVVYSDHALLRMTQRDIIEEDVIEALEKADSSHRRGIRDNRYEVDAIIGNRLITVVYEKKGNTFRVITVF